MKRKKPKKAEVPTPPYYCFVPGVTYTYSPSGQMWEVEVVQAKSPKRKRGRKRK